MIALETLTRAYGARRGVEDVDLVVEPGSLFGFLGPNGAGKSTTIRVLLGFLRPTSGKASIGGLDCWRDSREIKADVGYVPGDLRLYGWLTGEVALRIFGGIRGRDLMAAGRRLSETFALDMTVKVRKMSRGMRQKLGLLLAIAPRPRVLILDEPTTGLDPLMQFALHEELRALSRAGHTVFFSSHSLDEVEALCDRVAIIREGRIVADKTLAELQSEAGHQVSVRWSSAAPDELPAFLTRRRRHGSTDVYMLRGPVSRLITWLEGRPVEDLSIGRPDLENLFRGYYEGDA